MHGDIRAPADVREARKGRDSGIWQSGLTNKGGPAYFGPARERRWGRIGKRRICNYPSGGKAIEEEEETVCCFRPRYLDKG